jgi:hypothetical protein
MTRAEAMAAKIHLRQAAFWAAVSRKAVHRSSFQLRVHRLKWLQRIKADTPLAILRFFVQSSAFLNDFPQSGSYTARSSQ